MHHRSMGRRMLFFLPAWEGRNFYPLPFSKILLLSFSPPLLLSSFPSLLLSFSPLLFSSPSLLLSFSPPWQTNRNDQIIQVLIIRVETKRSKMFILHLSFFYFFGSSKKNSWKLSRWIRRYHRYIKEKGDERLKNIINYPCNGRESFES